LVDLLTRLDDNLPVIDRQIRVLAAQQIVTKRARRSAEGGALSVCSEIRDSWKLTFELVRWNARKLATNRAAALIDDLGRVGCASR